MNKHIFLPVFTLFVVLGLTACSPLKGGLTADASVKGNDSTQVQKSLEGEIEASSEAKATPVPTEAPTEKPEVFTQLDLEDNPFWDSLVYTGYNIEKHREDGLMWHYVLAANKRGKGWLSDITYAGGSTGYETNEAGEPDIDFFEKHGLVCASYATYVYYNYLPNISGIDTSMLAKPERSYSANDWYVAAKQWVQDGYSEIISFEAELTPGGFIKFTPEKEIPVGSIIAFCDAKDKSDYCSHVVVYAGYENDYDWVYHVGNENGPEFCSVQRMHFGPDPQWPICIITTPDVVWDNIS